MVIAVDPRRRAALATTALEAGRHVLAEKPLALGTADAARVRAAAERAGRVVMTGHVLRFHPAVEALLRLVRQGPLGPLRRAEAVRKGFGKFFPGVDAVWDLAPCDLSLLVALAGRPPASAEGRRARVLTDAADAAEIALDFGGGFAAAVRLSRVFPGKERRLIVTGERGVAVFDDLAPWPRKLTLARDGAAPEPAAISETAPLDAELRHFLDCIAEGAEPLAGAAHAIEVIGALEAIRMRDVPHAELPADLHPVGGA